MQGIQRQTTSRTGQTSTFYCTLSPLFPHFLYSRAPSRFSSRPFHQIYLCIHLNGRTLLGEIVSLTKPSSSILSDSRHKADLGLGGGRTHPSHTGLPRALVFQLFLSPETCGKYRRVTDDGEALQRMWIICLSKERPVEILIGSKAEVPLNLISKHTAAI